MALDPQIQIEVDAARASFHFHEAALRALLVGPAGPVLRDLARRALRVEAAAKRNASHSKPSVPGSGPAVQTGRLRGSITFRLGGDLRGPYADIGSAVHYAIFVENGTSRMRARPFLRPALRAAA